MVTQSQGLAQQSGWTSRIKSRGKVMIDDISNHEIFILAGSIAYTTALALAPFLIIMLSVIALLGQEIQNKLYAQLSSSLGQKAGATIRMIIENADNQPKFAGISGIIGFFVLALSASTIFAVLRTALDKINEREIPKESAGIKGFIKDKVLTVGLVFGFAFLSIVSMLVTMTIGMVFTGGENAILNALSAIINFTLFTALFTAMFRFIPSDRSPWKRCLISGVVSSIFYLIGKSLIELYLGKAGFESTYGAAGSLVIFLVWVYYTSLTLLISYEFTSNMILAEDKPMKTQLT
ncbi:MAG: YihY/virulence factor BrkB family protein [Bdellovibrionota bacterium]